MRRSARFRGRGRHPYAHARCEWRPRVASLSRSELGRRSSLTGCGPTGNGRGPSCSRREGRTRTSRCLAPSWHPDGAVLDRPVDVEGRVALGRFLADRGVDVSLEIDDRMYPQTDEVVRAVGVSRDVEAGDDLERLGVVGRRRPLAFPLRHADQLPKLERTESFRSHACERLEIVRVTGRAKSAGRARARRS